MLTPTPRGANLRFPRPDDGAAFAGSSRIRGYFPPRFQ